MQFFYLLGYIIMTNAQSFNQQQEELKMNNVLSKAGFASAGQVKLALLKAGVKLSAQAGVDAVMAHDKPGTIRLHSGGPALGARDRQVRDCGFLGATGQETARSRTEDLDDYELQQYQASFGIGSRLMEEVLDSPA